MCGNLAWKHRGASLAPSERAHDDTRVMLERMNGNTWPRLSWGVDGPGTQSKDRWEYHVWVFFWPSLSRSPISSNSNSRQTIRRHLQMGKLGDGKPCYVSPSTSTLVFCRKWQFIFLLNHPYIQILGPHPILEDFRPSLAKFTEKP
jgi:hypothetical protein